MPTTTSSKSIGGSFAIYFISAERRTVQDLGTTVNESARGSLKFKNPKFKIPLKARLQYGIIRFVEQLELPSWFHPSEQCWQHLLVQDSSCRTAGLTEDLSFSFALAFAFALGASFKLVSPIRRQ